MSGKKMDSGISALLHEHDCVIVPDFGGFIANYKPAHIHPRLEVICPPSKSISFNRKLIRNDGLITNYLAEKEGISYTAALLYIEKTVKEYRSILEQGRRLEIEEVGALYLDAQKNLQFIPDSETNFLSSAFGLRNVPLPLGIEEEVIETPIVHINREKKTRPAWWVGAAAVALPLALISVFLFQDVFRPGQQFDTAGLNPFKSFKKSSAYAPNLERAEIQVERESSTANFIEESIKSNPEAELITVNFEDASADPNGISLRVKDAPEEVATTPTSGLGLFFVIAGAFEMEDNAIGLVKDLKSEGYDAAIIGKRGRLHLVSYGAYNTKSSARKSLKSIQEKNLSGWIYKK